MKKILLFIGCVFFASVVMAQDTTATPQKKDKSSLANRSNDHFVVQLGYLGWNGIPDTINKKGISKTFNVYFMFDFPFKTNPHLSMAFGPGIATDHMLFTKTHLGIKDNTTAIYFTDQSDTNNFKKTKLATAFLEAPIEFRYTADPYTGKGLKLAFGVKVGTLLNAHTRSTKFQTKAETSLNDYTLKESSKRFFNKTRLSGMVRVGYGHFSLFGSYSFTPLFKDGLGPVVKPFSIGITLSGL
jgi:Outer membrane protein beta-barrel domain